LNIKKITSFDVGNQDPGFGPAQIYGVVKSVKVIPTLPFLIIGSPKAIQI
jgi:hypothetical protein